MDVFLRKCDNHNSHSSFKSIVLLIDSLVILYINAHILSQGRIIGEYCWWMNAIIRDYIQLSDIYKRICSLFRFAQPIQPYIHSSSFHPNKRLNLYRGSVDIGVGIGRSINIMVVWIVWSVDFSFIFWGIHQKYLQ